MNATQNHLSTEQILAAVEQLSLPEIESLFDGVKALRAKRKAPYLTTHEATLLALLNQRFSDAGRRRMRALRTKRADESLTPTEHQELILLTTQLEEWHARRMETLAELAKMRGVSLPVVMAQVGIRLPDYD
jgi:hypothetical protein